MQKKIYIVDNRWYPIIRKKNAYNIITERSECYINLAQEKSNEAQVRETGGNFYHDPVVAKLYP